MYRWPWRLGAIIGAALLPPMLLLPDGVLTETLTVAAALGAFAATLVGPRLHPSEHGDAYRLLRFGMGGFTVSTILDFSPLGLTAPNPVAGLTLLVYLASFVTIGLAMFRLAELRMGGRDTEGRIDAALIALATAAVLYDVIVVPALAATSDPAVAVVFAALPILQAPVAAAGIRLLISGAHRLPAAWMFVVAAVSGLVGSVAEMASVAGGTGDWPVAVLWILAYTSVACGALHPSARRLGEPVVRAGTNVSFGRLAVIGAALISMPLTLLSYQRGTSHAPAVAAAISVVLVLWRAAKLLLERERANAELGRRAQREAALSAIGHAAVVAVGGRAFVAALPAAVDAALGTTTTLVDEAVTGGAEPAPGRPHESARSAERLVPAGDGRMLHVRFRDVPAAVDADQFLATVADIAAGATRRWRAEELLRHQSLHDALTGLPNRALMSQTLQHALGSGGSGAPVVVLFIDLDGFKGVNDTLGHAAGDVVLGEVAERLRQHVGPRDVVGRLAGDEFVVICQDVEPADAMQLGSRILAAVSTPFSLDLGDAIIGASIGMATARDGESPEALLQRADNAMYHAKHQGKGCLAVAEGGPAFVPSGA